MSNLKKVNSIYEDILSKVKYDEMNERYYIDMYDYVLFSLDKKQYAMLEKVCSENNIYLEMLPKVMYYKETERLFRKLKELKEKLKICEDIEKCRKYEKEIQEIREKVFLGYQIIVWRLIAINLPSYSDSSYRDDIIQLGYIYLMRIIDNFDIDKCPSFGWYLTTYLSNNLFRDMRYIDKNVISNKDLIKLVEVRNGLRKKDDDLVSIDDLVKESGFEEKRVKDLLVLEKMIYADSIEMIADLSLLDNEEIEQYSMEDYSKELYFVDSLEEDIYSNVFRELLIKMVNTLSMEVQSNIVIMYYGLDGRGALDVMEIANIFGMTRQGVDYHLNQAIDNLKESSRLKYIKELVEGYTNFEINGDSVVIEDSKMDEHKFKELEVFLLKQLPEEELLELVSMIDSKYQKPVLSYLGLINKELSYFEKIEELDMSVNTYIKRRNKGLKYLRKLIEEKYLLNNSNSEMNSSTDYLMYRYLNGSKIKVRSR